MNRSLSILFWFGFLVLGCNSCNSDLDLIDESSYRPVVYCLLNPSEANQYVRVGKTFSVATESFGNYPPVDSLLWPVEAQVYMERWENKDPVETILFSKNEMFVRDSGPFPTNGLSIYQAKFQPKTGEKYHLYVHFDDLDIIVSGETQVMSRPQLLDPAIVPGRTITFDTISPFTVRWIAGDYPGLYQGIVKMNYSELLGNDFENKYCCFLTPIYYDPGSSEMNEEKINSMNFFKSVSQQLKPIEGVQREIINFEFIFYAAGSDLALQVNQMGDLNTFSSVGDFSNISGGMGVFSSRIVQHVPNLVPSVMTRHFLSTSTYTKDLGFIKHGND